MRLSDHRVWTINNDGTFDCYAEMHWQTGVVNNNADGVMNLDDGTNWFELGSPSVINNAGLLSVAGDSSDNGGLSVAATLNSTGVLSVGVWDNLTLTGQADLAGQVLLSGGDPGSAPGILHVLNGNVTLEDQTVISGPGFLQLDIGIAVLDNGTYVLQPNTGTVTVLGAVTADNVEVDGGTLQGPGTLIINQTMNWTGGTLTAGTLKIEAGAHLNINGTGSLEIDGWTINNYGTIQWDGGDLTANGGELNNEVGSTFNMNAVAILQVNSWNINNDGIVNWFAGEVDDPASAFNNNTDGVFNSPRRTIPTT